MPKKGFDIWFEAGNAFLHDPLRSIQVLSGIRRISVNSDAKKQ